MGNSETLQITISDPDHLENFENAVHAVESELNQSLSRGKGRPAANEISLPDVVDELATAYTGWDAADQEADDG